MSQRVFLKGEEKKNKIVKSCKCVGREEGERLKVAAHLCRVTLTLQGENTHTHKKKEPEKEDQLTSAARGTPERVNKGKQLWTTDRRPCKRKKRDSALFYFSFFFTVANGEIPRESL